MSSYTRHEARRPAAPSARCPPFASRPRRDLRHRAGDLRHRAGDLRHRAGDLRHAPATSQCGNDVHPGECWCSACTSHPPCASGVKRTIGRFEAIAGPYL